MFISIPNKYKEGYLFGSWNNWREPINLINYDFEIEPYLFYHIISSNELNLEFPKELKLNTTIKLVNYKIKINNEYKLLENEDEEENNYCSLIEDNIYYNIKID